MTTTPEAQALLDAADVFAKQYHARFTGTEVAAILRAAAVDHLPIPVAPDFQPVETRESDDEDLPGDEQPEVKKGRS